MQSEITIPMELAETVRSTLESKVVLSEATEKQKEALEHLEELMGSNGVDFTISTSVETGRYVLTDITRKDESQYGEAWLTIYEDARQEKEIETWDNTDYLTSVVEDIKNKNNKDTDRIKDTKEFCEKFNIDWTEFSLSLQHLYRKAVKLKMIKQ